MSLMEIPKSIPQNLDYSERNQILPKNDTQKSGNSQKMIPKNPGIAPKGTQKSGSNPKSTQNNGPSPYRDICKLKSVQSALSDPLTTSATHGTFSRPSTKRGLTLIGLELNTNARESFEHS